MNRHIVRALLTVGLLLAIAHQATAANYTWTATNGGVFQTAGSWSPTVGPPGVLDTALFNANATYTVSFSSNTTTTGFTQQQGIVTLAIGAGQTYHVSGSNGFSVGNVVGRTASLLVTSGTLSPDAVNGGLSTGGIGVVSNSTGNLTVTGAGTVFSSAYYCSIGIAGTGSLTVQNNAAAIIPNVPYIGSQFGSHGSVVVASGGTFSAPDAIVVGNSGTGNLAVNGGGSASLDAINAGQFAGSSGTVSVGDATSAAALTVANNIGLQVAIGVGLSGTGVLNVNGGGTLTGAGNVSFANATGSSGTGTVSGTWNQTTGSMYIGGATTGAAGGTGSLTVNNGGALTLSGSGAGITTIAGHGTLTINAGGAVTTPTLTNNGTLNLQGGVLSTGSITNSGVMTISGGTTDVFGAVQNLNAGQIIDAGTVAVAFHGNVVHNGQEIRTAAGGRTVFFGAVSGIGPYTGAGTVEYDGVVQPGNSPALLTYAGDLALRPTAALDVLLGGTTAGSQYDQFAVTGAVTLSGALNLALVNGFNPQVGQRFDILTYGTHTGNFTSETGWDLGNGLLLTPNVTATTYSLVVTPVPEPSELALLTAVTAAVWRRRTHSVIGRTPAT